MCFSPTASFISGSILITTGIYSLRQVRSSSAVPFASIPLLFGIQQIVEGVVWLSFGSVTLHSIATTMFVMFSHVFWPIFVPLAIWLIEKNPIRKKMILGICIIGVTISSYLFACILLTPVTSRIIKDSIDYFVAVPYPLFSFFLYFVATCGAPMLSSSRKIHIFGTAMLLAFFVAHTFYPETLFSVWCFFAAALSVIICIHMRDLRLILPK